MIEQNHADQNRNSGTRLELLYQDAMSPGRTHFVRYCTLYVQYRDCQGRRGSVAAISAGQRYSTLRCTVQDEYLSLSTSLYRPVRTTYSTMDGTVQYIRGTRHPTPLFRHSPHKIPIPRPLSRPSPCHRQIAAGMQSLATLEAASKLEKNAISFLIRARAISTIPTCSSPLSRPTRVGTATGKPRGLRKSSTIGAGWMGGTRTERGRISGGAARGRGRRIPQRHYTRGTACTS